MRTIVLIIIGFSTIFGLTIYLCARINTKYMIKAVDIEGKIFKELIKKVNQGEELTNIKNVKSIKKNIKFCKWMEILVFVIIFIVLIVIETILKNYNINGLRLYIILYRLYCIYGIILIFSSKYKSIIASEYIFIFTSIQKLKELYEDNIYKIPFSHKVEIYNLADNQMKFKNKNGINQRTSDDFTILENYINNNNNEALQKVQIIDFTKQPMKKPAKLFHFKETKDEMYTTRSASSSDGCELRILKNNNHPFYSVYAKRYTLYTSEESSIYGGKSSGYIEISSNKAFDLPGAKKIANKLYDIAILYNVPGINDDDFPSKLTIKQPNKVLSFQEKKDGIYSIREADIEDEGYIRILKNDNHHFYSIYAKKRAYEHGITNGYMEISSNKALNLSQAKKIANKLYSIVLGYKAPGLGVE